MSRAPMRPRGSVAGRLPGSVLRTACDAAADVAWLRHGGGVRQLERNLRARAARARRAARCAGSAAPACARTCGTSARRSRWPRCPWTRSTRGCGPSATENLRVHTDRDQAVVLALGHTGNWDLAGAWAARAVAPVTTVAERLEPEELFQEFVAFREEHRDHDLRAHGRRRRVPRARPGRARRRRACCRCWPTATSPPRVSRSTSSATAPGSPPDRPPSRSRPAPRWSPPSSTTSASAAPSGVRRAHRGASSSSSTRRSRSRRACRGPTRCAR